MNYICKGIYNIICIIFKKFVNNIKEAFQYANIIAPTNSVFIETKFNILVLANSYISIYVLTDIYQYFVSDIFHENVPYVKIIYTYNEP